MKRNKAFKIIMVVGVVLLVIGLLITLIGYLTGGVFSFPSGYYFSKDGQDYVRLWNEVTDYELWTEEPIDAVSLKIAYGTVNFVVSDTKTGVEVKDYAKDILTLEMNGSELRIHDNRWTTITNFSSNLTPVITVYLSQEALDRITVEQGAGNINLSNLTADSFSLSLGAGDCKLNNFDVNDLTLESGAGNATLINCTVQSFTSSMGAGDVSFEGDITKFAEIECGAGNAKFKLAGAESNYAFDVSYGVGTFVLNGSNHSGFGGSETINASGAVKIMVSAGVGNVTVQTA